MATVGAIIGDTAALGIAGLVIWGLWRVIGAWRRARRRMEDFDARADAMATEVLGRTPH